MSHSPQHDRDPAPAGEGSAPVRARRQGEGAWLGGVATGVAQHLGWPVSLVRAAFVLLGGMQMVGVLLYGLLWVLMPAAEHPAASQAPGLEAAARRGLRCSGEPGPAPARGGAAMGTLTLAGLGAAMLAQRFGMGPSAAVFWPLVFAATGVAIVWRQADSPRAESQRPAGRLGALLRGRRPADLVQVSVGLALVGTSVSMAAASRIGLHELPVVLGFSALLLIGIGIAAAPWLARWRRASRAAHERALLEQARADMAAHLHDSVLQTLALIQRQADDPRVVAQLARRQERELRAWLYGDEPTDTSLKAALARAVTEIEDERGVDLELVCVGDAGTTEATTALVRAAREAMLNAAKHSGASRIDVFCEVEDGRAEVFVRDRGAGFDLEAIGDDRMGVRRSILERMERHGGTARIRTAPGEGTEVRLAVDL